MQHVRQIVAYKGLQLALPRSFCSCTLSSPAPAPQSKSQRGCAQPTLLRHLGPSPFHGPEGSTSTALACSRFPQFKHHRCCQCTRVGHIAAR